jgi:hypothetical protein
MHSSWRLALGLLMTLLSFVAVGSLARRGLACDTPVYRYAMYRWEATPYELYYFHRKAPSAEAVEIQEMVDRASRDKKARANVVYLPVNLDEDEKLINVPADVKQAWEAQENPQVPSYMLVTPRGVQVYQGDIDKADVAALLESPARAKVARLLEEGSTGVFLFLEGKDAAANKAALEAAGTVIADVEAGNIKLYSGAVDMFPGAPKAAPSDAADAGDDKDEKDAESEKDRTKHQVGLIRIARDDAREVWLRRMLMATERDLAKYGDEPMLFAVYGRGRALPAFIGNGISRDNLLDCLYFISGACSCTVKEQNPGVDLLVRHDWNAAAEKLAEKFGSEEGNDKFGVDNLFPELVFAPPAKTNGGSASSDPAEDPEIAAQADAVIAGQASNSKDAASETGDGDAGDKDDRPREDSSDVQSATGDTSPSEQPKEVDASKPSTGDGAAAKNSADQQAATESSEEGGQAVALNTALNQRDDEEAGDAAETASKTLWYTLGIGVGIAAFVLISATLLLYRPK